MTLSRVFNLVNMKVDTGLLPRRNNDGILSRMFFVRFLYECGTFFCPVPPGWNLTFDPTHFITVRRY